MAIAQLAGALEVPLSSLFPESDDEAPTAAAGRTVGAVQRGSDLVIRFRYDRHDAEYILANANMEQYDQVVGTLAGGLASAGSNADAVANTFICATAHWPDANPSDLWTFLVSRIYGDPLNHPPENDRLNLEQSWKRTSGWALERVLVRHYAHALGKRGIGLKIGSKAEKQQLLGPIDDARILPDKADVLITHRAGGQDDALLGVVHVKASLAERRTDDVPMSQALTDAGFLSVFWTMDAKSFQHIQSTGANSAQQRATSTTSDATLSNTGISQRASPTTPTPCPQPTTTRPPRYTPATSNRPTTSSCSF